ncbi:MAG: TetR family transcriptional regulator [Bacteroidota bacterium]
MSSTEIAYEKKEHIMDIAEKLFAEYGYEAVSTRKLAADAQVNIAMISYYFGSKEDLYLAVIERRILSLRTATHIIDDKHMTHLDKLLHLVDMIVDRFFENRLFHQIMYREMGMSNRSKIFNFMMDKWLLNFNVLKHIIEDGIQKKVFKKVDAGFTILTIIGTPRMYVQSDQMAQKIMNLKSLDEVYMLDMKNRLKNHLKELISNHLSK